MGEIQALGEDMKYTNEARLRLLSLFGRGSIELETGMELAQFVQIILEWEGKVDTSKFAALQGGMSPADRLIVTHAHIDNSVILVSEATLGKLQVSAGDMVLVKNAHGKGTILIVEVSPDLDDGYAKTNEIARENLRIRIGDTIRVETRVEIGIAKRVAILPLGDTLRGVAADAIFENFLQPYLCERERPFAQGDRFVCDDSVTTVEFKVVDIHPPGYVRVGSETRIHCEGGPIQYHSSERALPDVRPEVMSFEALPKELRLDIGDGLSIDDCFATRQLRRDGAFQDLNKTRFSISTYFTKHLLDGTELMRNMAESNAVALGPPVSRFFFPEHIHQGNTWYFVVPRCRRRREHFMKFMERKGVRWDGCGEIFRNRAARRQQITMSKDFFNWFFPDPTDQVLKDIKKRFNESPSLWLIIKWTDDKVNYLVSEDRHFSSNKWEILHGRLQGDTELHIEMLYSSDKLMDYRDLVTQLPVSAHQCFISGFGAVHMYGKATAGGTFYEWTDNKSSEFGDESCLSH